MSDSTTSQGRDLLAGLNEPQRQAVTTTEGPLLVLAGPGSGKTRVITNRIAWIVLEHGIAPWNVLAITFTNKAAAEMRNRVSEHFTEKQSRAATICTFHSLCARLLRQYAERMNLPSGYSIYDTADQQRAVKAVLERLQLSAGNFSPGKVLSTISNAKNELMDAAAFAQIAGDFYSKSIAKIYTGYEAELKRNHALDFDDLLLYTVRLLRRHTDVLEELRDRFQYVLIDEYQDTNHAQFVIANALAAEHKNICATGDPDQSIYRWRGADIRNILDFEQHYPDATVVRLEQNYRSTKRILSVADQLIQQNAQRKHKTLWSENEDGSKVRIAMLYSEKQEAQWVVDQFRNLQLQGGVPWSGMAAFYRANHLSRVLEEAFRDASIPYQIARGTAFYDRKEIKDAVAYLRAIANPADEINLLRIINTPARGISDKTVKAVQAHAVSNNMSIDQALRDAENVTSINVRAVNSVNRFLEMLDGWRETAGTDGNALPPAPETLLQKGEHGTELRRFVERILRESGLEEYYRKDDSDPDELRLENLGELVSMAQQFEMDFLDEFIDEDVTLREKLEGLLERIALVSDVDAVESDKGAVTLMTLHAAKGLEFPVVAIVGVEEGLLPHQQSMSQADEIEEERRLGFVGITRAKQHLMLTHVKFRTKFGQRESAIASRFLNELPEESIEYLDESRDADEEAFMSGSYGRKARSGAGGGRATGPRFSPGMLVRHPSFGVGQVLLVTGDRIKVKFESVGSKMLVAGYAKLQPI